MKTVNNIISYANAEWLKELGFSQNNLKGGYATDSFEVCVPNNNPKIPSAYHDTEVGEFVADVDYISFKKDEKKLIAAPTALEAMEYIRTFKFLTVLDATYAYTQKFFQVCKCGCVILVESKPAETYVEAVDNLLSNIDFRHSLIARLKTFK